MTDWGHTSPAIINSEAVCADDHHFPNICSSRLPTQIMQLNKINYGILRGLIPSCSNFTNCLRVHGKLLKFNQKSGKGFL